MVKTDYDYELLRIETEQKRQKKKIEELRSLVFRQIVADLESDELTYDQAWSVAKKIESGSVRNVIVKYSLT